MEADRKMAEEIDVKLSWYKEITTERGLGNTFAIGILGEIKGWFRTNPKRTHLLRSITQYQRNMVIGNRKIRDAIRLLNDLKIIVVKETQINKGEPIVWQISKGNYWNKF